jgi:hypothetical protein
VRRLTADPPSAPDESGASPPPPAGLAAAADGAQVPGGLRENLRENYRQQLINSIGGWTGTLITAIPPVVFVVVNAIAGLRPAIIAAIATGVVLAAYRLVRRQSTQQAISGLVAVVVAALIAARTGQARGYFLLGIWSSFAYAVPFAASVLVRRPLVGVLWEFLDPTPGDDSTPWRHRRGLLRAYVLATLVATALFLSRGIVQLTLYRHDSTGWLAFARVAMGYPLYILAVGICFWLVTRTRRRVAEQSAGHRDEQSTVAPAEQSASPPPGG